MTSQLPDQTALWNKKYSAKSINDAHVMPFGQRAATFFAPHSRILEIGCGLGADANYFATQGHHVIATDLSTAAIEQAGQYFTHASLEFRQLDVSQPLAFENHSFEVVYSHLALHYYTNNTTKAIFSEITRVLAPGGILAFACKTVDDAKYGEGTEIEPNMFVRGEHIRHFFSVNYVKDLLKDQYDVLMLQDVKEDYADQPSAMVWCVAKKRAES